MMKNKNEIVFLKRNKNKIKNRIKNKFIFNIEN